MTKEEFAWESHAYIDECFRRFDLFQNMANEILDQFILLCKKHDIQYYMMFGTLLGTVRDHGNMPWDYDLDVMVPIDQRQKLIQILDTELSTKYYYAYKNNTHLYPADCLRISQRGYPFMSLHLDIFFMIGCPPLPNKRKKFVEKVMRYGDLREKKGLVYWLPDNQKRTKFTNLLKTVLAIRNHMISLSHIEKKQEKMLFRYNLQDVDYFMCPGDVRYRKAYPMSVVKDTEEMNFAGRTVTVPKGYDELLTILYKDYKQYMSIDSRFDEFMTLLQITDERQKLMDKMKQYKAFR